tara:strand:- start:3346 stop:3741 length:396 start_codon:yes stop_codon:yes gene_type:complete
MDLLEAIQKREAMKIGKRTVAEILTHKNGIQMLMVNRTLKDIIRGRNKLISHAMEEDQACWPVETILLSRMKRMEIGLLVVNIKASNTTYISRLSDWIDESSVYTRRKRNGSFQRILPMSFFQMKAGKIKI